MNLIQTHTLNHTTNDTSPAKLKWTWFDITIYLHFFIPSYILFKQPFEFYITYIFIIAYLPFLVAKYPIPRGIWWILLILLITGLINVWLDNNIYKNFFKIYLNIAINLIFYSTVVAYYNYDVEEMFRRYLKGAVIVCIYAIVELVAYKLGMFNLISLHHLGFNKWGPAPGGLGIRVNSTYPEPTHFAQFMSPAAFVAIYSLFFKDIGWLKKWECIVIVFAFFLSYSSLAFTGIFIMLLLLLLNYGLIRYIFFALPVFIFLFYILYNNIQEFRDRMDGIKTVFIDEYLLEEKDKDVSNQQAFLARQWRVLNKVHGSPLVLYNNYYVAMQNFKSNPLFGTSLGSHEIAFQKYNLNYLISKWYLFNTPDANSMGLRIVSELGLMGIIFTFFFIRNYFVFREEKDYEYRWIISSSLLVLIILQLLRQGNYTFSGFFFFAYLYYLNKQMQKTN
ncbi:MAG: hypothetical protein KatS3mg027_0661 [Bacteroidia bacterium]|nr:MAG: hypothetical protein KatS3mg027_0661 [Bacteroidia bacterium]